MTLFLIKTNNVNALTTLSIRFESINHLLDKREKLDISEGFNLPKKRGKKAEVLSALQKE